MPPLQVIVIDDHPVIEKGLKSYLSGHPDYRIAGYAPGGQRGLELLRRGLADVVIMELALPDMQGVEVIRLIREEYPTVAVLVYSGRQDENSVFRALKAGARGYVLKSSPLEELLNAVRSVAVGDYVLSPGLTPAIIEFYLAHRMEETDRLGDYQVLTEREKQVFRLLANGKDTEDISRTLHISPKTVAKHRAAIKKKLSLKNTAEIAQYAMRIGVVDVESATSLSQGVH